MEGIYSPGYVMKQVTCIYFLYKNTTNMLLLSSCFICSFLVPSSFSLPGKWGHKRSGFKFALPGKWGSILKRNSAFGFSLPGQWAGKRSAEYAMSNDVRMAGCDVDTLSIVLQMYDFIKVGSFSHVIRKNAKLLVQNFLRPQAGCAPPSPQTFFFKVRLRWLGAVLQYPCKSVLVVLSFNILILLTHH